MRRYTSSTIFPIPLLHIMLYCIAILLIASFVASADVVTTQIENLSANSLLSEKELKTKLHNTTYTKKVTSNDGSDLLQMFLVDSCNLPSSETCDGTIYYNRLPILPPPPTYNYLIYPIFYEDFIYY